MNHASATTTDEDGWTIPRCTCGWKFGPVPDHETATDVLMDHAYDVGGRDGQATVEAATREHGAR